MLIFKGIVGATPKTVIGDGSYPSDPNGLIEGYAHNQGHQRGMYDSAPGHIQQQPPPHYTLKSSQGQYPDLMATYSKTRDVASGTTPV